MRCITFHRIHPLLIIDSKNADLRKRISVLINEGLKNGVVQPLPYRKYQFGEIKRAIKYVIEYIYE